MKKRSQIQMMESTLVLMVFFFLLVIGVIIYMAIQKSDAREKDKEYAQLNLIKKAQLLNYFPELRCTQDNVPIPDCFDELKLKAANESMKNNLYYKSLLGEVQINITKTVFETISPTAPPILKEKNVFYYNASISRKSTSQIQMPVSIYDPIKDRYWFGIVYLDVYS
jgi:hypothetical protein